MGCDSVEKTIYLKGIYPRSKEKNMKHYSLALSFTLIFGSLLFIVGPVIAPVGQQHNIWGTANEGVLHPGVGVLDGSEISAWIDGVYYGINITTGGTINLYIDGDTWGIPPDDSVKSGGYDGDSVVYFLDYNPMDYYLKVSHTTSSFKSGDYHHVDFMFFNRTDQAPSLTTLRMLKINEIILDPGDGLPQYVFIYDPGQNLGINNISDYYLQKDDNVTHSTEGEKFDFLTHVNDIIDIGEGYYYVNLTSDLKLNDTDELKLVWKNPYNPNTNPALTGPGNGTDIVIDRVEWGNYTNYINPITPPDDRDYDNTTLLDFINTPSLYGSGASMIRTDDKFSSGYSGNGTDTDNCFADFKVLGESTPRPQQLIYHVHNPQTGEYFGTIQAAIYDPDTQDGHTIAVAAGIYTENVVINKSISLIGQDKSTTTIKGMVTLNTISSNIRNFKIVNPGTTSLQLLEAFSSNIQNLHLENNGLAICCLDSNKVTIQDCLIRNNTGKGIVIGKGASGFGSNNITVKNNIIENNTYGIYLNWSLHCTIINNTISQNRDYGFYISDSTNTRIYHNNLIANKDQAYDNNSNQWDNDYPSGGNFWSDYRGIDRFSGSNQVMPGNDEIGDTNYTIDNDSVDKYPLKSPLGNCSYLYEGWNFISLPFIQPNTRLDAILSSMGISCDSAQWYNASDFSNHWKHYHVSKPSYMNDLVGIDYKMGFWIHIPNSEEALFQYPGTQPLDNQKITLYPGWNLVGYPSLSNKNRTEALNNIHFGTDVDSIWTYDTAAQVWMELDEPADCFEVGRGYWIHSKVTIAWDVPL